MNFTRLYTGEDGESHCEDFDIALHDHGIFAVQSKIRPAGGIIFRTTQPENEFDWHNAPRRQYAAQHGIRHPGLRAVPIGSATLAG